MARKIGKSNASPAADPAAGEDLVALHPHVPLMLAGRAITIREYGFWEGLEVAGRATAFIADLVESCTSGTLRFAQVRRLFGKHKDVIVEIAAQSADVEPDWILSLDGQDAELFLTTWFTVNTRFFMREVVEEVREAQLLARTRRTGSGSLPDSPAPASAISTGSESSPSAS